MNGSLVPYRILERVLHADFRAPLAHRLCTCCSPVINLNNSSSVRVVYLHAGPGSNIGRASFEFAQQTPQPKSEVQSVKVRLVPPVFYCGRVCGGQSDAGVA